MINRPHPGSDEALDQGCSCPVLDNARGAGIGCDGEQFGWWISGDCPMHGEQPSPPVPAEAD